MELQNGNDKKQFNRSRIARFILKEGETSKPEIASVLRISMPTVLQNVKELMDAGVIEEVGEYESTGGRKAKALSVVSGIRYSVGIDITANHISYVLVDIKGNVIHWKRIRCVFEHASAYYESVRGNMDVFVKETQIDEKKILGVGISLPGIIDKESSTLIKSHILNLENVSLKMISQYFDREPVYENDASSAAMAELGHQEDNAIYLSLSNTVGGAIYMNQEIYPGDHFRSAEFGHMTLVPEGAPCYCGKRGCVDAYCSARVLSRSCNGSLETFFDRLAKKEPEAEMVWDRYKNYLAITIGNLRTNFDCDVILGGYVGGFLSPYLIELGQCVMNYNRFDRDSSYIRLCRYTTEASAVGIAMTYVDHFMDHI